MKSILVLCICMGYLSSSGQSKNAFYALDASWNQTVLDSSKYILWVHENQDSNWQWDYYNTWGPLIKSESFADHDGTIYNGRSYLYNKSGNLDSVGCFNHGKKNGSFYKYKTITPDSVILVMFYEYAEDSLLKMINYTLDTGKKSIEDTTGIESEYPGGMKVWNAYLMSNLKYPERAINKEIQGQVRVAFVVDKEGKVKDPYISKSVEYSLDQESIRVILNSGTWTPAFQHDHLVKSYKVLPINYKLQ